MEHKGSSPCARKPATGPYPEQEHKIEILRKIEVLRF
jgi:hypothetical protein